VAQIPLLAEFADCLLGRIHPGVFVRAFPGQPDLPFLDSIWDHFSHVVLAYPFSGRRVLLLAMPEMRQDILGKVVVPLGNICAAVRALRATEVFERIS
jgi:hypothetical protein